MGEQIDSADRFEFGDNWANFLTVLDDERIEEAIATLKAFLGVESLDDVRFLDIGCGSGLFSLAARRLGAEVVSFDFDSQSVSCTEELKRRYFPDCSLWRVESGSALDREYMETLGTFDVVYSWGVLHHTGAMWLGLEHALARMKVNGLFYVALYNDQGWKSRAWWFIKSCYGKLPRLLRPVFVALINAITTLLVILKYTLLLKPMVAIRPIFSDRRERGMSAKFDKVDWIGGFPYEFVSIDVLLQYFAAKNLVVVRADENSSHGCHEVVVQRQLCAD